MKINEQKFYYTKIEINANYGSSHSHAHAVLPLPIVIVTAAVRYPYYGVTDECGNLL